MSHPGQRIPDDEEEIELNGTGIQMADDSEIRADHKMQEGNSLLHNVPVSRKRSCIHSTCRICMGIVATAVFTFMLIQLWSNYGDTIKQRVFSPQVVGAGCFDADGEHGKTFGVDFHKWVNSTLHLNITKPTNELLQVDLETPQPWSYTWEEDCLQIALDTADHITVMVWSI